MSRQRLIKLGVDEDQLDRIITHFESKVRTLFEVDNINYDEAHIEELTHTFLEHWHQLLKTRNESVWDLDRLENELKDETNHTNVGFIIGMEAVGRPMHDPIRQLANARIRRNHR